MSDRAERLAQLAELRRLAHMDPADWAELNLRDRILIALLDR